MFKTRNHNKELLDGEHIPETDLFLNLKELHAINKWLGGYKISMNAFKKVLIHKNEFVILDIGSGGGDFLKEVSKWNLKFKFNLKLYGIDIKQSCINYSVQNNPLANISFICDDYRNAFNHITKVNIIHACLFCHHLNEKELVELILFCTKHKITLIINDLERNRFAYYAIKILTRMFSKSYLVKNDAPLSVLRGFKRSEWNAILKKAGAKIYSLKNKWAFRHQIIVYE